MRGSPPTERYSIQREKKYKLFSGEEFQEVLFLNEADSFNWNRNFGFPVPTNRFIVKTK